MNERTEPRTRSALTLPASPPSAVSEMALRLHQPSASPALHPSSSFTHHPELPKEVWGRVQHLVRLALALVGNAPSSSSSSALSRHYLDMARTIAAEHGSRTASAFLKQRRRTRR